MGAFLDSISVRFICWTIGSAMAFIILGTMAVIITVADMHTRNRTRGSLAFGLCVTVGVTPMAVTTILGLCAAVQQLP